MQPPKTGVAFFMGPRLAAVTLRSRSMIRPRRRDEGVQIRYVRCRTPVHHHTRMCTAVRSCSANAGISAGPGLAWPRCLQGTSQLRGGEGPSSMRSADIRKTLHPGICLKKSLQNSGLGLSAAGILKVRVDGIYKSAGKSGGSWKIITHETVT